MKTKTTKAQAVASIREAIINHHNTNTELFKKGVSEKYLTELLAVFDASYKTKPLVEKVQDGQVYCNYFEKYMPAELFDMNSRDKYRSASKEGLRLIRQRKTLHARAEKLLLAGVKTKAIDADTFDHLYSRMEELMAEKYQDAVALTAAWDSLVQAIKTTK